MTTPEKREDVEGLIARLRSREIHGPVDGPVDPKANYRTRPVALFEAAASALSSLLEELRQAREERVRFKDEDWPLALQRLNHCEPGHDQGLAIVGTDDLAFALRRLAEFANEAMSNAAEVGRLAAALQASEAARLKVEGELKALRATSDGSVS